MKKFNDPLSWVGQDKKELNADYIEINKIQEDANQPRVDYGTEEMEELKESIKVNGVIEPIILRTDDKGYCIISGHRRFRACSELGLLDIPAIIKDKDISEDDILLIQLEENLHRKNLSPLELANTYKIFQDEYNLSTRDIAKKVHKSHHHVEDMLKLLSLPDNLKEKVALGTPVSKVLEANKLGDKDVIENINNISRDEIREKNKNKNDSETSNNAKKDKLARGVPDEKYYNAEQYILAKSFNDEHSNIKLSLEKPNDNFELVFKLKCRKMDNLKDILIILNKAFNNY
ncbi:MAG: ParB/RepB/Spo0J family partition protein [bacterium]